MWAFVLYLVESVYHSIILSYVGVTFARKDKLCGKDQEPALIIMNSLATTPSNVKY